MPGLSRPVALRFSCFARSDFDCNAAVHGKRASALQMLKHRNVCLLQSIKLRLQFITFPMCEILSCCSLQPSLLSRTQSESLSVK